MPSYLRTNNRIKNLETNKTEVFGSINKAKKHSRTIAPNVTNSTDRTPILHHRCGVSK